MAYDPITVARFWSKVRVTKDDKACWLWAGATKTLGYGRIKIGGKSYTSSRVAWELFTGVSLGEKWALHRCDNPACCNPLHIYAGTPKENSHDSVHERAKGKIRDRIAAQPRKRLTRYQAMQVKALLACGLCDAEVANIVGVTPRVVGEIRRGDTFQDAPARADLVEDFRRMLGAAVKALPS